MQLILFSTVLDLPRTNNVAEGWHNAFASMNGVQRPAIFRFIDNIKKDEDLARKKMVAFVAGDDPAPRKRKYIERDAALKNAVLKYKQQIEAEKDEDSEETDGEDESLEVEENGGQWLRTKNKSEDWLKSPEMELLTAVAHKVHL